MGHATAHRGVAALLLLASCRPAPSSLSPAPGDQYGTYRFSERVAGSSPLLVVDGELTFRADSIEARVGEVACLPTVPRDFRQFTLECGTVGLSFERADPLRHPTWSAEGTAMVQERVCRRRELDRFGVERCVEYRNERALKARTFRGELHPKAVP